MDRTTLIRHHRAGADGALHRAQKHEQRAAKLRRLLAKDADYTERNDRSLAAGAGIVPDPRRAEADEQEAAARREHDLRAKHDAALASLNKQSN